MLKTRVLTALILFFLFLGAVFYLPPIGWLVVSTAILGVATWEWGGFMRLPPFARLFGALCFILICGLIAFLFPSSVGLLDNTEKNYPLSLYGYLPALLFWVTLIPLWLRYRWALPNPLIGYFVGALVLLPTWLALIQLKLLGNVFLLSVMATVWIADIAAYFVGRAFGKHKLAPNISPGKTWEGAIGGILGVVIYGMLLKYNAPIPAALENHYLSQNAILAVFLILLATLSIMGDLFESLLKRQAGLKDSSQILPGHGGIFDRIDSLTSTLPLVALICFLY